MARRFLTELTGRGAPPPFAILFFAKGVQFLPRFTAAWSRTLRFSGRGFLIYRSANSIPATFSAIIRITY